MIKQKYMTVAIIPARGGSKGIPKKNLYPFCGKPLLVWSIEQALAAKKISSVWVTSDCPEILKVAKDAGASPILRPKSISGDTASSELAWHHACDFVESAVGKIDIVVGMQATSPLREPHDIDHSVSTFLRDNCDSLISCTKLEDFFLWQQTQEGRWKSVNYDYEKRLRRQDIAPQFLENGSLYLFKPELLRKTDNRLGGKIGVSEMAFWKSFEIDSLNDLEFCQLLMDHYIVKKAPGTRHLSSLEEKGLQ